MDAQRWGQIKNLFQEARELPVADRKNFLQVMCSADLELREQVEAMLAAHEKAAQFLAKPAAALASTILAQEQHEALIGQQIGPYEILSLLGVGGMGAVYRALDKRLGREVAVKILLPVYAQNAKALAQFEQEAKAVAALSHPNILIIHDFGAQEQQYYSVTELLEGETLRARLLQRRLDWQEAAAIGISLANGLSAAHLKGILHRDLKPENIFLLHEGSVKILDFGLARVKSTVAPFGEITDAAAFPAPVEKSSLMGTPGYVSPEQIRGAALGPPSDLFALGCVLFEMLAGKRAFAHEDIDANLRAILAEDPLQSAQLPPKLPTRMQRILARCLAKDPRERYQDALDIALDLREALRREETLQRLRKVSWVLLPLLLLLSGIGYAALKQTIWKPIKTYQSIAVLPFTTKSQQPDAEYLGEGFADGLISKLSQVSRLRVLSQQATFKYQNNQLPLTEIGRLLNADALALGEIIQHGNYYSLEVRLIDSKTESLLWSEQYSQQQVADFQVLQNKIATMTVTSLGHSLGEEERRRLGKKYTENPAAYDLYLRGRSFFNQRRPEAYRLSVAYFKQAIEIDAHYALAYSGLADVYITGNILPGKEAPDKIRSAVLEALYLDNSLAEAHTSLAAVRMLFDWNWAAAEQEFKEAVQLNPSYLTGLRWHAFYLSAMGEHGLACREIKRAVEVDPQSAPLAKDAGLLNYFAGHYQEALAYCQKAIEIDPGFPDSYLVMGRIQDKQGHLTEALELMKKARDLAPQSHIFRVYQLKVYKQLGLKELAQQELKALVKLEESRQLGAYHLATAYVAMGLPDDAFSALEKSYQSRSPDITNLLTDPELAGLQTDQRLVRLANKIGLPNRK